MNKLRYTLSYILYPIFNVVASWEGGWADLRFKLSPKCRRLVMHENYNENLASSVADLHFEVSVTKSA